jgi:23S rRNA (cytosine1962-C5)-methyltransferase
MSVQRNEDESRPRYERPTGKPGPRGRTGSTRGRRPSHAATGDLADDGRASTARVAAPPGARSPWVLLRSASDHPFIYRRMIRDADPAAAPGDIVSVYDKSGALFGAGLYNPRSEIVLRMLTRGDAPAADAFFQTTLARAVALRRMLRLDEVTDAYRLVHAEGDGLSGVVIERYADCLVAELFALGMAQRAESLMQMLAGLLPPPQSLDRPQRASPTWRVLCRADERAATREGLRAPQPALGTPTSVVIREHGVRYRVDLATGHKTGFFCDQRDNRLQFARLCRDANVLDCCCYTGGFGLCAKVLGGAADVTSVDLDEAALAVGQDNVNLNQARVSLVHADVFIYLRQMLAIPRQFDAVVLDPPKLAMTREGLPEALRKYHDLNHLGVQAVRPGGVLLTCSCSGLVTPEVFAQVVRDAARRARRTVQIFEQTGAAADHPVLANCPDSAYLKALWLRVW